MIGKSKKVIQTERWVDRYIAKNGYPPTYSEIEKRFKLSRCAAWNRCAKFREKMRQIASIKTGRESMTKIDLQFMVPNSKFEKFTDLLAQINALLKQ